MVRVEVVAVGLLVFAASVDADFSGWNFWSKFAKPWEVFIQNSYDIQKAVNVTDTNNDGVITLEEIGEHITTYDSDGDRRVTRSEFVRNRFEQYGARIDISNNNFDNYDWDGDNYLTVEDVDMLAPMMAELDSNKDEELSSYELIKGLRQMDLAAQRKADCETYYIYRLPPREMKLQKKKCASRKM
ncbi:calmodulin-4-like [Haliotis rubra]|uniref:calmodulin-4-like n=1 Tax=Haliotis rubra TaxID=36100 RepID=UPI001EE5B237|nr:calmodulin-4-like [Haliotis rubra]